MGMDDIFINFIVSYLAGSLSSLKNVVLKKGNETLQERIDKSFDKALEKWCADDAVRRRIAHQYFTSLAQLTELTTAPEGEESSIAISNLIASWAEELSKDEECAHLIQEQTLSEINAKMDKLFTLVTKHGENKAIPLKPRGRKEHKPVDNYMRRYCSSEHAENDFVAYLLEQKERKTLADYVIGLAEPKENKFILYSSAQTGKTTELKQLCWELQQSGLYLPISFEVRTNTTLKREDLPVQRFYDDKEIVVVIDALDEVNGKKYDDLIEEIGGYAYDHPDLKMVLSCRSNFRRDSQMNLFKELYLQDLTASDAKDYVFNVIGEGKGQDFIRYVNDNELGDFIKIPFFLRVLVEAFKDDNKQLPKNKFEIYKLFIEKSYQTEKESKNVTMSMQHSFDESVQLLERVALGLSLMNVQSLNYKELKTCLYDNDEYLLECLRFDLIQCESGRYSFKHNAFREWLVANYLNREGITKAKAFATHPNGRLKPEWYNIIMLWVSMYGKDKKEEVDALLSWLKESSLELIIYIDVKSVDEKTRNEVFKGILLEYKSLGIRMSNIMTQDYKNLLKFGQTEETVDFIADELQTAKPKTAYYADLICLCYFLDWRLLRLKNKDLTEKLFQVLEQKAEEALEQDVSNDLSFLYFDNEFFTQKVYLERIFAIIGKSEHHEAIRSMIRLIAAADRVDEYVDYILEKEGFVHNQQEGNTTHIVTRTSIFTALAKVKELDSIKKILSHQFYRTNLAYHDEQEEYWNMLKSIIGKADEYIKHGNKEISIFLQEYYANLYKDFNFYFDRDKQPRELLMLLRRCYEDGGLREQGREFFHEQQLLLFDTKEGGEENRGAIRKLYLMAALWITVEDVEEDFEKFKPDNGIDWIKAGWYREIPYVEVAECAIRLYNEKYPQSLSITKGRERRRKSFDDFTDYGTFKQTVLEMVAALDEHTTRKDHHKNLRKLEEGYNQYAFRFFLCYSKEDDKYDINGIIKGIKDKDVYDAFFMKEIAGMVEHPDPDLEVTKEILTRCVDSARKTVINVCKGEQPIYSWRVAVELMLKGYFEVPLVLLPKLILWGDLAVSKRVDDGFYCTEYSLFEYIAERVDKKILTPIIIEIFRPNVEKESFRLSYRFANYIVENRIEEGYDLALQFATSGFYMSANILESLIKNRIRVEEIKALAKTMKEYDKLTCYSTLVRNTGEDDWVKEQLETEYKQFEGYNIKLAVRLLLSIGSMDALDYLTTHPELMKDSMDFHFNYENPNAIPSLCYLIQYNHENKIDDRPFLLNSILSSLEKIALKDYDSLTEVKQYLMKLTQKGNQYKYLNRFIISYEDKYYASYSGIGDIKDALRLVDSSSTNNNTASLKDKTIKWKDDEGVYVSYNWESHSLHTVEFLCFVLESKGIPYKRDKKDCCYSDNIKDFMDAIRAGNTVIVVFSRPYLKSRNCMYELSGILNDPCYKDRILPVVVDDTIRESQFYVDLVKFWKEEKEKQENVVDQLIDIDSDMAEPEIVKMDEINKVYSLLKVIKDYIDWINADNLDYLSSTRFGSIVRKILEKKGQR